VSSSLRRMVEGPAFDFASHNVRAARNETQALKEFNIPPILLDNASRAAMTVSRRDRDLIPKMGKSLPSKASPSHLAQRSAHSGCWLLWRLDDRDQGAAKEIETQLERHRIDVVAINAEVFIQTRGTFALFDGLSNRRKAGASFCYGK
jgi:hypothetical protein